MLEHVVCHYEMETNHIKGNTQTKSRYIVEIIVSRATIQTKPQKELTSCLQSCVSCSSQCIIGCLDNYETHWKKRQAMC